MMTIKAFAELCGCTAQTLRYYDRVGVLRPAKVDKWSGYRYYEERQALDFIKIRNLQAADFTIGEVCALLSQPDEAVYAAFERQIAAQEEKLRRIREIQQTYLREKNAMEKLLKGIVNYLLEGCRTPAVLKEFGYEEADYDRVMAQVREWLETTVHAEGAQEKPVQLTVNGEITEGAEQAVEKLASLSRECYQDTVLLSDGTVEEEKEYEIIWESHGWAHPHEFLRELPSLTDGRKYQLKFEVADFAYPLDPSYGLLLVGVLRLEHGDFLCRGCEVDNSGDGVNHFFLMREKTNE